MILLFYKLVESKKPKSIFTGNDIYDYMKGKFGRWGFTKRQLLLNIHTRQLRYHVYKRVVGGHFWCIYVRRSGKEIMEQIKNMKAHGR